MKPVKWTAVVVDRLSHGLLTCWSMVPRGGEMCSGFIRLQALNKHELSLTRQEVTEQNTWNGKMGRLPRVFKRDLSIRQTYLYAKNKIIAHFTMRLVYAWHKNQWVASTTAHWVWIRMSGCCGKSPSPRVWQDENHFGRSRPCISCRLGFLLILSWSSWFRDRHLPLLFAWNPIQKWYFWAEN